VFSLVYSAGNVALPAFAAERRAVVLVLLGLIARVSINISCPHSAQQQTRRTLLPRSNVGWMDGHPSVT